MKNRITIAAILAAHALVAAPATERYVDAVAAETQTNAQVYADAIVAAATNGIPEMVAAVTNGIPESVASIAAAAGAAGSAATTAGAKADSAIVMATAASNVAVTASASISSEAVARQNADSAMSSAISAETSARASTDAILYDLVDQSLAAVSNRATTAALSEEIAARTAADASLGSSINSKQDRLTAGLNITISNNVISAATGSEATHIPWANVIGKPDFKTVSWTASYSDLIGTPDPVSNETIAAWGYITDSHLSASYPTFSNAVLAVGLNIDTNAVAVLGEIAAGFGGFPIQGTATTLGGLLAAICAAIVWLRQKKADKVASATNGNFAGLDANGNLTDSNLGSFPAWTSSTIYSAGAIVSHLGSNYICIAENSNPPPGVGWTGFTNLNGLLGYFIKSFLYLSGSHVAKVDGNILTPGYVDTNDIDNGAVTSSKLATDVINLIAAKLSDNTADYSSSSSYAVGSFCKYNGALYVCKVAIASGGEAWTEEHWTAMPNVTSLFSGANTSLMGVVRYDLGSAITADATLLDRTINLVQVSDTDIDLTLPDSVSGKSRDFLIRIEMAAGATGTPSLVSFSSWEGDDMPTFAAGKNYLLTLTETKANTWYFRAIELEAKSSGS